MTQRSERKGETAKTRWLKSSGLIGGFREFLGRPGFSLVLHKVFVAQKIP